MTLQGRIGLDAPLCVPDTPFHFPNSGDLKKEKMSCPSITEVSGQQILTKPQQQNQGFY